MYVWSDAIWHQMGHHNYGLGDLGQKALQSHQTTLQYVAWYADITHLRVHNPAHGNEGVNVRGMHAAVQHRLQPMRQDALLLSQ